MRNLEKYKGVIPAFYACYDNEGNVSPESSRRKAYSNRTRCMQQHKRQPGACKTCRQPWS